VGAPALLEEESLVVSITESETVAAPEPLAADLLHGAQAIADEIGVDVRRAFYLLERGHIPAQKLGRTWTASRTRLRQHFLGE
jgi:hypothetical protein